MAEIVYLLCAATSLICALRLLRAYLYQLTGLLLWSTFCFAFLTLNNILLFVDLTIVPHTVDLSLWRGSTALVGLALLLFGLIWESR
jgi:hypothetical protein